MNIYRISRERLNLALELISLEVRATRGVRNSSGAVAGQHLDDARDARNRLLPLLQSAAAMRDIDLILRIEKGFLTWELEHLATSPERAASLNMALSQGAAEQVPDFSAARGVPQRSPKTYLGR